LQAKAFVEFAKEYRERAVPAVAPEFPRLYYQVSTGVKLF